MVFIPVSVKVVWGDRDQSVAEVGEVKPLVFGIISKCIDAECWTQKHAAEVLEIDQPKISHMKNGRMVSFSLERLFRFLFLMGYKVVLKCISGTDEYSIDFSSNQEVKLLLMDKVAFAIDQKNWTQKHAASVLKLDQPKVSHINNRKAQGFSVERLLKFLSLLEYDLEISIQK